MKKTLIIIGSLIMVAILAGSGLAWGPGHGRGMGSGFNQDCPGYGGQGAWSSLSKDQRDELTALRQQFIDETYELRSAKFQNREEARMLMETSDPDRTRLKKLSSEISDLDRQIRDKRIDFQLEAKKISPELGMGFGRGRGKWSDRSGRGGHRGYGAGCYNN